VDGVDLESLMAQAGLAGRIGIIAAGAVAAHFLILGIFRVGDRFADPGSRRPGIRKLRSVMSLAISAVVFTVYFLAIGFVLREFGVSLTAYLASASIVGLAVGFGSQGLVQDVVTGLTLIFSDLFDVGEMVEISGQSGLVRKIGMRFVELGNSYGARIFIPNRTITNVINYPRGYVRFIADIRLSADPAVAQGMREIVHKLVPTVYEQFPGILLTAPSFEGELKTSAGTPFVRIKFRVWPNRGEPIEKTFKQELVAELKKLDPDYAEWMVAVYYEVEQKAPMKR
jgi:small conductance mechanosensitive channel